MGLDVHCQSLLGVEVERFAKTTTRRKYNEDTGEPYEKEETVRAFRIVGTAIEVEQDEDGEFLKYVDHSSDSGWFLGVILARTESHRLSEKQWFEVQDIGVEDKRRAEVMLKQVGCDMEPKLFVFVSFGY